MSSTRLGAFLIAAAIVLALCSEARALPPMPPGYEGPTRVCTVKYRWLPEEDGQWFVSYMVGPRSTYGSGLLGIYWIEIKRWYNEPEPHWAWEYHDPRDLHSISCKPIFSNDIAQPEG